MFFVGSLSTILPYLTTIIVMCIYMVMGQPTKDFLIEDLSTHRLQLPTEVVDDQAISDLHSTYAFEFVQQVESCLTPPPFFTKEPDNDLLCPCSSYSFLAFVANGNKAPPVFI